MKKQITNADHLNGKTIASMDWRRGSFIIIFTDDTFAYFDVGGDDRDGWYINFKCDPPRLVDMRVAGIISVDEFNTLFAQQRIDAGAKRERQEREVLQRLLDKYGNPD